MSLGELIPANHPVRAVSATIDRLDISGIEPTYNGDGTKIESAANKYTVVWKGSAEKVKNESLPKFKSYGKHLEPLGLGYAMTQLWASSHLS